MNGYELVRTVLDGGEPPCPPVALHNFLMNARLIGHKNLGEYCLDARSLAQGQITSFRLFGHDLLEIEDGVTAMAQAVGCKIAFSANQPPHVAEPILGQDFDALGSLKVPDPWASPSLRTELDALIEIKKTLGDSVYIMGRADQGPMALAAAIRGPENFLFDLMDRPRKEILALLEFCTACTSAFIEAIAATGAHGSAIGGYGLSIISPQLYREFEAPFEAKVGRKMHECGLDYFLHFCGNEKGILDDIVRIGADCLELAPLTDPVAVKLKTKGRSAVLGMLDPAGLLARGKPDEVRAETKRILDIMAPGGGFIVAPGCALPYDTPAENISAMIEAVHKWRRAK